MYTVYKYLGTPRVLFLGQFGEGGEEAGGVVPRFLYTSSSRYDVTAEG